MYWFVKGRKLQTESEWTLISNMSNSRSLEKALYFAILKTIMKCKGKEIRTAQLTQFLLRNVCPWFCEEESPDLHSWEKLCRRLFEGCISANLPRSTTENVQKVWTALEMCVYSDQDNDQWSSEDLLIGLRDAVRRFEPGR